MNESICIVVAGIDVGKVQLDVHLLGGGGPRVFRNDKGGRRAVHNWLLRHGVTRAVFEPTGRNHRNLHQCLAAAGIETVLVNPLRSRHFAEALERLAKNDRVDAAMLARFGLLGDLAATPPRPENLRQLSDLVALRRKLLDQFGALCKLCADMPELGTISRRQAASLLGLAPPTATPVSTRTAAASAAAALHRGPLRGPLGGPTPRPATGPWPPAASLSRSPWWPS